MFAGDTCVNFLNSIFALYRWCGSVDVLRKRLLVSTGEGFLQEKRLSFLGFCCSHIYRWTAWALALDSGHDRNPEGVRSRVAALSCWKEPDEVVWASDKNAYWVPSFQGFLGMSNWVETLWLHPEPEGFLFPYGLGTPWDPQGRS